MSREIDEDIDPIRADKLDQCIVVELPDLAPVICGCAQALGDHVLEMRIAVQDIPE